MNACIKKGRRLENLKKILLNFELKSKQYRDGDRDRDSYRTLLRSPEAAFKRRLMGVLEHPEPPPGYATVFLYTKYYSTL